MNYIDLFYRYFEPLILSLLLAIVLVLVTIRLWVAKKSNVEFPSKWRRASSICIIITTILLITYFALSMTNIILAFNIMAKRIAPDPVNPNKPKPYTDAEVVRDIKCLYYSMRILFVNRVLSITALYMAKLAFVAMFMASAYCLSKPYRYGLYAVAGFVVACFIASLWLFFVDRIIIPLPSFTSDDIRIRGWDRGASFFFITLSYELALTVMNIACDILLTIIAYRIVKTIQVTSGTATLLLLMVVFTVTIASARVVLVVLQVVPDPAVFFASFSTKLDIPTTLLSEFEIFFGAIVSCLPGLRAWRRHRMDAHARDESTLSDGERKEGSSVGASSFLSWK